VSTLACRGKTHGPGIVAYRKDEASAGQISASHAHIKEISHILLVVQVSVLKRLVGVEVVEKRRKASNPLSFDVLDKDIPRALPERSPRAAVVEGQ